MWISQIELTNFKSYQHQIFDFPQSTRDKNIVLVGGMNGYGKTTILEAIYLGLYGAEAIIHLARAGLKGEVGYRTFLEKALHGHALRNQRDTMSILIQINVRKLEGFQVLRRWYFKKNGDWDGEDLRLYSVESGVRSKPLKTEQLTELLDQYFLPAHLAPFFFFDGEEVKKLANQDRVEQIKQGMEGLMGVVLLRKLQKRLRDYQINMKRGVPTINEEKHKELFEKLTRSEQELENLNARKVGDDLDIETLKQQRTELTNRIMALGGGGGDIATMREIVTEQMNAKSTFDVCQQKLDIILTERLPFHLIAKELVDYFHMQMRMEKKKIEWDNECEKLKPKKDKLLKMFFELEEPKIDPGLDQGQTASVAKRLELAWASLFFPPPVGCAEDIVHDYLSEEQHVKVINLINKFSVGADDIRALMRERDSLIKRIKDLDNKRARLEGLDRDGTLAKLNSELSALNGTIDQKQKALGALDREITALTQTVNDTRATYEREHERFILANPVNSMIGKAETVYKLIGELVPRLYQLKTKHLANAMTEVYRKLAHKKHIHRIEITEEGASRLLSKDGTLIPFDKSAGEDQLFATALLAALAKVSGIHAPLVVDTPLGRLDSLHRENILSYWVSNRARQVILLSQDKEIDQTYYLKIKEHVLKTYLLEHQEIGSGVGKTFGKENCYFGVSQND